MILPVWIVTLLTLSRANANTAIRPSSAETSTIQSDERAAGSSETESMTILVTTDNVRKSYENANLTNETENKINETENKTNELNNITNENENNTNSYETKNMRKAYESILVTDEAPKTR